MTSFILTLDTTAPVVTWGPVDGAVLGEQFTIQYLINEPGIVSAELQLADGRTLDMEILPDRLRVQLPDDTPDALATVRVHVRDDVGNEAWRTTEVPISGVPYVPPETPTGIPAGGLPGEAPKRWRTVARLRSQYRVIQGTRAWTSRATVRSRYTVHRSTAARTDSRVIVRSRTRAGVLVTSTSRVALRQTWTVEKQAEGPRAEEDLLILGIL